LFIVILFLLLASGFSVARQQEDLWTLLGHDLMTSLWVLGVR
jgi:hypothetical protein